MKAGSKLIVVDASIARSAGATNHPVSRSCREFLEAMLIVCHRSAMTAAVRQEWKKHQSAFATRWLAAMTARKKVATVVPTADGPAIEKLAATTFTDKQKAAVSKDLRLVHAALASDSLIASLDETVRNLFRQFLKQYGCLNTVVWVNPSKPEDHACQWLQNGAPAEKQRMLGYIEPEVS